MILAPFTALLLLHAFSGHRAMPTAHDLTLTDRIHAQEAIERVYWEHRIWPPENRAPKPSLEGVLTRAQIQARVLDYLRKSNALATLWNRPITAEQLQAEMRRMASESQAPGVLRELFAALGDDPFLIAETLARQTLADRLIREAYTRDPSQANRSFDAWWVDAAVSQSEEVETVSEPLEAVDLEDAPGCVADTWKSIPPAPAPFVGQAVWTGSEMIVWGQYDTGILASGGRYNPATNSWTMVSDIDAPSLRFGHRTVWTGQEMVVWGGVQGNTYPQVLLNDGGRYDPTTDSWRRTSTGDGTPGKRYSHTAVWTGSEMIIFGGRGSYTVGLLLNDGARYNPSNDTWAAIAPGDPRTEHVAVWTGSEMIVWGGYGPSLPQVGARYSPASDTWVPTTRTGAPTLRQGASAVWTGHEMIIWGGDAGFYLNSGGRYDPSRDIWTPTSLNGDVPVARGDHSAIWTGHEMIIWGGLFAGQPINADGGRYNPAFDTWARVSPVGAPFALLGSAVVWTGSEMLIYTRYGGTSTGYSGRYCASTCEGATTLYKDADGDGYGDSRSALQSCAPAIGYAERSGDCNDANANIHPGAVEACNQIDDDCNNQIDNGFGPGALSVNPNPTSLWPPNHQLVDVHVGITLSPTCPTLCPAPVVVLASVSSNESDDGQGTGDGTTVNDIQDATVGSADFDIKLRAERDSQGTGRRYRITYTATDCFGDSASADAEVIVPVLRGGSPVSAPSRLEWSRRTRGHVPPSKGKP